MPRMTEKGFRVELGKLVVQDFRIKNFSNQAAYSVLSVVGFLVAGCWLLEPIPIRDIVLFIECPMSAVCLGKTNRIVTNFLEMFFIFPV